MLLVTRESRDGHIDFSKIDFNHKRLQEKQKDTIDIKSFHTAKRYNN